MLAPALAHAQAQVKRPIYVECSIDQNSDDIGKGLCSSLRDAIAKSPRYTLLDTPGKEFHSIIILSTVPIVAGSASATSAVFGFAVGDGAITFLGHQVLATGINQIDGQAASILVDFDTVTAAMLKATP